MTKNKSAAFMSYVHSDDKYGQLTTFRERLSDEVQMQIGAEFTIFQDRKDIKWGQNWRERIENSIDEITFLIPIITPSFFNSEACRAELNRFIEREKKLGRNDLILPVYFVETPLLNDAAGDELAEVIASRQYEDWRELRFEPFTNPQVGRALAKLAVQIRNAQPHVQMTTKTPARTPPAAETQPTEGTTSRGSEEPIESPTAKNAPPTCTVDPMHQGDFTTITAAIERVQPGTRILVRPGLYREGLVIDKPLEIIGDGGPGDVVIQAMGMNVILFQTTMGRVVNMTLQQMGGDSYCVDIAQGRLELEACDITSQGRACVAIRGGADPRLRRNRIHDSRKAGGVVVHENAQATVEDNDIFGNLFSGVAIMEGGDATLRSNRIHDNQQAGVNCSQGTLEDNEIFANLFSGVQITGTGNTTLRRNRIHDGHESGVYVIGGGHSTLEDNDIFGNAISGVEIKTTGNPLLKNNRINKNGEYGIWVYENGGGTFENNDLTENGYGAWSIAEDSEANVTRVNNKE